MNILTKSLNKAKFLYYAQTCNLWELVAIIEYTCMIFVYARRCVSQTHASKNYFFSFPVKQARIQRCKYSHVILLRIHTRHMTRMWIPNCLLRVFARRPELHQILHVSAKKVAFTKTSSKTTLHWHISFSHLVVCMPYMEKVFF
jgi:hypothetical protein